MGRLQTYNKTFLGLGIFLIFCLILNISLGSVFIPVKEIINSLFTEANNTSTQLIIKEYRLPKSLTAILVGSSLSVCGLLMQTLFRNPLAGPFVLGISSGASLGVAILILGAGFIPALSFLAYSKFGITIAASLGAALVLIFVLLFSNRIRNTMAILIIGLMFGSISAAIISVLSYLSDANQLQQYIFWGFGNLGNLSWDDLTIFAFFYFICLSLIFLIIKPLNSFLLGENYAASLGVNIRNTKRVILIVSSILTGIVTAFSGPIAFVGIAVPHISKMLFKTSNHKVLIPATLLIGAILMLIADTIAQIPLSNETLPINAITSLFGSPIVIWLLIRKNNLIR